MTACAPFTSPAQSAPLRVTTPTANPGLPLLPSNWGRYLDAEDGFSFGVPPGARVTDSGRNPNDQSREIEVAFLLAGATSYQGMNVRIEPNASGLSAEALVRRTYARLSDAPPPADLATRLAPARAGNLAAFRTSIPPSNSEVTLIVLSGTRAFLLSPVHPPGAVAVEPAALDLFYAVVATFAAP